MGIFDGLAGAFANEKFEKPPLEQGLSKGPKTVQATYNGKTIDAIVGGKLRNAESSLRMGLKYNCDNGECGTCECLMDGRKVRPCVARVPNKDFTLEKR